MNCAFDLAELEITLEGDGKLEAFRQKFQRLHDEPWEKRRLLGLALNEASAVLHHLNPNEDDYLSIEGYADPDVRLQQIILKNFERGTLYDASSNDTPMRDELISTIPGGSTNYLLIMFKLVIDAEILIFTLLVAN